MGSWKGHIAGGSYFTFFGLWWYINNCIRYLRSLASETNGKTGQQQTKFQGSTTYPCTCLPIKVIQRLPIESILKIIITTIDGYMEIMSGMVGGESSRHLSDEATNHLAFLSGFFVGAWIEILVHYGVPLPKRINQVMLALAFGIEGFVVGFHLHDKNMVNAQVHRLATISMLGTMISALAECFNPNNFWFIVARCYFCLTQGTWFLQGAFVMFPITKNPRFIWDLNSHESVSYLTACYAFHLAGDAIVLVVVYLLIYKFISPSIKTNVKQTTEDTEVNGEYKLIINMHDDDNGL